MSDLEMVERDWIDADKAYRQQMGRIQAEKTRCYNQIKKSFAKYAQLVETEQALIRKRQYTLQHLAVKIERAEETATWEETPRRST